MKWSDYIAYGDNMFNALLIGLLVGFLLGWFGHKVLRIIIEWRQYV